MPLNDILPIFPQVRIIDSVDILIDDKFFFDLGKDQRDNEYC